MSQQDNFAGGFVTGALFGGVVGGIIGALAASRLKPSEDTPNNRLSGREQPLDSFDDATEENMELARRRLEDKIAQLNEAIDDVRQQLGGINGYPQGYSQGMLDDPSLIDS
ncbi:MAG TPA: hypothetical protein V6D06_15400 [Trichocoleus sp.]